ncbi:glutathione transferase GstA [Immundisolibacter cernigliae]|uniref:Glutathione S-transferase n=1 Tax=Immundisolibacter cernigliae TaxID=1810504 RepID=A0A1B1YRV3_9GAMM|nr:glutathione transferase GstA [Immundisolibacter cernigliae]ANX03439.1 glutathione S-transferase [Immundisolibacter cernigliae]
MKLYYTPGACSMAPHIALREAGLSFDLEKVDLMGKKTETGADFTTINPKGYVPALQLDNGQVLTEVGVLLQYIADQKPASGLAPAAGTLERYRLMETLNFIATELHKSFGPLFNPASTDEAKKAAIDMIGKRFGYLDQQLAGKQYLLGDTFTVADCYFGTVLGWCQYAKLDLSPWPAIGAYAGRVMSRPAVLETLKAEGLMG